MSCYTCAVETYGPRIMLIAAMLAQVAPVFGQSGVSIDVDKFGVGNAFRQGDLTAVRLKLTSSLAQPTSVWVQWQVPNADGDIGEYGRSLTLTPSQPALTWLYAPLPPDVNPNSVWTVRVFEERDGERRGEVGGNRIRPAGAQVVEIGAGMVAVVGQPRLGLEGYSKTGGANMLHPFGAHEDTMVVSNIKPSELPDRWFGLMPFEALVWAGDNNPPQEMGLDQADAVREYVRGGGHFVICLPATGNQWGLGVAGQTELEDLLPCRSPGRVPRKDEAVQLVDLMPSLSKYNFVQSITTRTLPTFSIRVFKDLRGDFDVIDNHFEPLVALPDGRVIVIQRQFGFGRVTVIGVDLAEGRMGGLGLPQADALWNRILGRRADTPTAEELIQIKKADLLGNPDSGHENSLGSGATITSRINMEGTAGKGLLMALLLFAVYWLAAGPGGFALLKQYGMVRHAWLAFAACAAIFTAIAWGGVSLFPKKVSVSHVTFLDHIARTPEDPRPTEPQYQRAVSYFSVYMPDYGSTPISIESAPDQRDLLMSWTPPGYALSKFPNVDRFRVEVARNPGSLIMPSRSTATQFKANWLGGLDREWGGTLLVDPNNPIRVDTDSGGNEPAMRGRIVNQLPGDLKNVTVIWVKNNRFTRRRYATTGGRDEPFIGGLTGAQLNSTVVWRLAASPGWMSGASLELYDITTKQPGVPLANNIDKRYIDTYAKPGLAGAAGAPTVDETDRRNYLEMMSFFQQLNPPDYLKKNANDPNPDKGVVFHRELGRELDLSAWFSRPCLIIIGFLEDAPLPIPLNVAGRTDLPVAKSLTVVRWIYPLPLDEKAAFPEAFVNRN